MSKGSKAPSERRESATIGEETQTHNMTDEIKARGQTLRMSRHRILWGQPSCPKSPSHHWQLERPPNKEDKATKPSTNASNLLKSKLRETAVENGNDEAAKTDARMPNKLKRTQDFTAADNIQAWRGRDHVELLH